MADSPSLVVRAVWFLLVGWWASGLLMSLAYLLSVTVVGLALGVKLFNYLPDAVSLKKF